MESIFFTFQLGFVILIVLWAIKNDRAGDEDSQQGLFALRPGLPAKMKQQEHSNSHHGRHRQRSRMTTQSRKNNKHNNQKVNMHLR